MLPQLSSNMLGEAEQTNALLERDSLGEIANVICGNATSGNLWIEPVFHLDAPSLLDDPESLILAPNIKRKRKCTSLSTMGMPR